MQSLLKSSVLRAMTLVCLPAAGILLNGCGGAATQLPAGVPVSGVVTLNGEPLADASILFVSESGEKGTDGYGATDAAGKYEIQRRDNSRGVPPGEYKVVINHFVGPGGKPIQRGKDAPPPIDQGAVESLPERYSSLMASQLKATVSAEGSEINFDLQKPKSK